MAPNKLENGDQHAMKWHPISEKVGPNVVLASLIAGYLYMNFFGLHSTYRFHSQSFH